MYYLISRINENKIMNLFQDDDTSMSDSTSESETSSLHGLFFNEDEQQAFKVWKII